MVAAAGPHPLKGLPAAGPDFCRDCVISWGFCSYVVDFMNDQGSLHEIKHHDWNLMNKAPRRLAEDLKPWPKTRSSSPTDRAPTRPAALLAFSSESRGLSEP
jgi:hypothetical protein